MTQRLPPFLGHDGAITLAAAIAVALLTLGLAPLAAALAVLRTARSAAMEPAQAPARILALGHRLKSGVPSADFTARLGRALALAAAYPSARVVLLGGREAPGIPSEAAVGRDWLAARGLDPTRISLEAQSRHTLENLTNHRAMSDGTGPEALITSRLHLYRAMLMARGLGLTLLPVAAEDRLHLGLLRLLLEGFLVHWYVTGRFLARTLQRHPWLARIR